MSWYEAVLAMMVILLRLAGVAVVLWAVVSVLKIKRNQQVILGRLDELERKLA